MLISAFKRSSNQDKAFSKQCQRSSTMKYSSEITGNTNVVTHIHRLSTITFRLCAQLIKIKFNIRAFCDDLLKSLNWHVTNNNESTKVLNPHGNCIKFQHYFQLLKWHTHNVYNYCSSSYSFYIQHSRQNSLYQLSTAPKTPSKNFWSQGKELS